MSKTFALSVILAASLGLSACSKPAETANATNNASTNAVMAADNAMANAGNAVDNAANAQNAAANSLENAASNAK
jgi:hypothetical protein